MDAQLRLMDLVRERIRTLHYSYRTEQTYCEWIVRFIRHHGLRHPSEMGGPEVEAFLSHLATERDVAAATQAQALAAILFLYKEVIRKEIPWLQNITRARRPKRLPVVLSQDEVRRVIGHLDGQYALMAGLMYGSGLRLLEMLRLRVKDVDFEYRQVLVRDGKGFKDRVTMLPDNLVTPLTAHLEQVKVRHEVALQAGHGGVELPYALERKYPRAHLEWGWQYVFPAAKPSCDKRTGAWRRHHVFDDTVQRQVKTAMRKAGVIKHASCHTFRHCFALAPRARWRAAIVPTPSPADARQAAPVSRRWPWAPLLRRVFALEVLVCPRCGGPRRILGAVTEPHAVQRLLAALGLAGKPPPPGAVTAR